MPSMIPMARAATSASIHHMITSRDAIDPTPMRKVAMPPPVAVPTHAAPWQ